MHFFAMKGCNSSMCLSAYRAWRATVSFGQSPDTNGLQLTAMAPLPASLTPASVAAGNPA